MQISQADKINAEERKEKPRSERDASAALSVSGELAGVKELPRKQIERLVVQMLCV